MGGRRAPNQNLNGHMRKILYRIALIAFFALGSGASSLGASVAPAPRFPNILLVTVDTLRADRLSGYGYNKPTSPHIDSLLRQGARFAETRCVEPLTGPSLTSMLTSLYPHEHGATRNGMAMRPDLPSLPKVLERRGFRTAALISNWTLKKNLSGLGEHFDEYREVFTRKRWFGLLNDEATGEDVTEAAIRWLEEHHGNGERRPFFTWVHYVEPHAPYRFHRELSSKLGLKAGAEPPRSDRYDTEVAFVDAAIGRLLDRTRELYPAESLLIIFTSDHGENLGEHGYWGHGRHLWEENLRIPLSLTWKDTIPVGVVSGPSSNLDLAPTILGLLGLPQPETFQGFDWSEVIRQRSPPPQERITYHQAHKGAVGPNQNRDRVRRKGLLEVSQVSSRQKESLRIRAGEEHYCLYALPQDSKERRSLVSSKARPSEGLAAWLASVQEGLEAADQIPTLSLDEESIEKLRSLGYLD